MRAEKYPAGTVVFREGDRGETMFLIRKGQVRIFREVAGKELVLAFLGEGEFFGEMALLEGLPRSASATITEDAELVPVDSKTFEGMIRRNIEIAVRMLKKLSGRVRQLDARLEKMSVESSQERVLDVLRWLMPQGLVEGDWLRVHGVVPHLDIAAQAGISNRQAEKVLKQLKAAGCVRFDGDDVLIADRTMLDGFESYIELRRKYEGQFDEDEENGDVPTPEQSLRRLMHALNISSEQMEARQARLAEQYQRYQELKERFKGLENIDL